MGLAEIAGLIGATVALSLALLYRERRAADPIVPFAMLRTPAVAVASGTLFLATAALFAITVFVPLFLQTTPEREPDRGRAAARRRDARHHDLHDAVGAQHRPHRALQALPGRSGWR